jgi:hypothetical protein
MSKPNGKLFLWILLLILLALTALVASATTLAPMSFEQLTRRATAIVRVRCVSTESLWSGGEIWTDTRFAILEEIKPDVFGSDQRIAVSQSANKTSPSRVSSAQPRPEAATAVVSTQDMTVRQLGGHLNGLRSHVDGVPAFQPGEELYLFLWRRAGEPYRVLGWSQGTFRIVRDSRGNNPRVTQDSTLAILRGEEAQQDDAPSDTIRYLPLSAFQQKLRRALRAVTP